MSGRGGCLRVPDPEKYKDQTRTFGPVRSNRMTGSLGSPASRDPKIEESVFS